MIDNNEDLLTRPGAVGELPVHLCYIYGGDPQIEIAEHMIKKKPDLLKQVYTGEEYKGENLLHIAIIKKRLDLVKRLVKMEPDLVNGRAVGTFFEVCVCFLFRQGYDYPPIHSHDSEILATTASIPYPLLCVPTNSI